MTYKCDICGTNLEFKARELWKNRYYCIGTPVSECLNMAMKNHRWKNASLEGIWDA